MLLISNAGPLDPEWLDHPLGGDWEGYRECHIGGDFLQKSEERLQGVVGYRECHIGGDFLLIYQLTTHSKHGVIVFVRAGTHADLFE